MKKEKNKNNAPKKQIEQTVQELTKAEIKGLGYEIWDIEYHFDGEWVLEITIENPSGDPISFDDCEKVTRAVGPILDSADPIEGSYCLAVGSPGLNRELKSRAHLEKYINKEVTVRLFAKNDKTGEKNFSAVLKALGGAEANFVFELSDNTEIELTKKEIAHIYALDKIDILGRN